MSSSRRGVTSVMYRSSSEPGQRGSRVRDGSTVYVGRGVMEGRGVGVGSEIAEVAEDVGIATMGGTVFVTRAAKTAGKTGGREKTAVRLNIRSPERRVSRRPNGTELSRRPHRLAALGWIVAPFGWQSEMQFAAARPVGFSDLLCADALRNPSEGQVLACRSYGLAGRHKQAGRRKCWRARDDPDLAIGLGQESGGVWTLGGLRRPAAHNGLEMSRPASARILLSKPRPQLAGSAPSSC